MYIDLLDVAVPSMMLIHLPIPISTFYDEGYKPATFSACAALWDAFEPKACDIHCKISTYVVL